MEITRYSANNAINNFILGDKANQYKHIYIDDNATPCCDMENKIIYSPVLPPTIDNVVDTIIRGKNEHEAGHARFTPSNKKSDWSVTKGELINALEDERIERGLKNLSNAFENDLNFLNRFMINKLNTNWQVNGCQAQPVRESIIALHMKALGYTPMWEISQLANDLITSVESIYFEGKNIGTSSSNDFNKIVDIADRILAIWENIINNNANGNADGNTDDGNTDGNAEGNTDNGNAEGNTDNGNTDGNAEGNTDDGNTDGNAEGNTDDGNTDGNTDNGNADGNTDGNAEGNTDDGNIDGNTDDKRKNKSHKANGRGGANKSLDDYCNGEDLESILEKELKDKIQNSIKELGNYTAYTDNDEIIKSVKNKYHFDMAYQEISGIVSMLASYLEQSLRTQSRCRNIGNRDKGYLDCRALPKLAKNLTKNVFYTQKQGISLDTTVSILVDESGSMDNKISKCRSLAIAISEVLERLKIKFEILGHTTGYGYAKKLKEKEQKMFNRTVPMVIYEHKNFNESYQAEKYRLGSMNAYNRNVDGEALLATFKRAMEQKSNRHIILVLSDGQPSGATTGGEKHLCDVVNFCRKNGAEVYAFGIGTSLPKLYYGEDNFIYLPTIKDLKNQFFRQLSNIIVNGKMEK